MHRCEHKTLKDCRETEADILVLLELFNLDCTQSASGQIVVIILKKYILLKLYLKDIGRTYQ